MRPIRDTLIQNSQGQFAIPLAEAIDNRTIWPLCMFGLMLPLDRVLENSLNLELRHSLNHFEKPEER
jgi:hypothetical protein